MKEKLISKQLFKDVSALCNLLKSHRDLPLNVKLALLDASIGCDRVVIALLKNDIERLGGE